MIWNKSKRPADLQQGTAAAPKKGGAAAFAQKTEAADEGTWN